MLIFFSILISLCFTFSSDNFGRVHEFKIHNPLSEDLEPVDVEVIIDTRHLIQNNLLRKDCSDIVFSCGQDQLYFSISFGCNTKSTHFFLHFDKFPSKKTLKVSMYFNDELYKKHNNPYLQTPPLYLTLTSSTCPSPWEDYRVSGYLLSSSSDFGSTGGSLNHSHISDPSDMYSNVGLPKIPSKGKGDQTGSQLVTSADHRHKMTIGDSTVEKNIIPKSINFNLCVSPSLTLFKGMIGVFLSEVNGSRWNVLEHNGYFLETGGLDNDIDMVSLHSHSIDISYIADETPYSVDSTCAPLIDPCVSCPYGPLGSPEDCMSRHHHSHYNHVISAQGSFELPYVNVGIGELVEEEGDELDVVFVSDVPYGYTVVESMVDRFIRVDSESISDTGGDEELMPDGIHSHLIVTTSSGSTDGGDERTDKSSGGVNYPETNHYHQIGFETDEKSVYPPYFRVIVVKKNDITLTTVIEKFMGEINGNDLTLLIVSLVTVFVCLLIIIIVVAVLLVFNFKTTIKQKLKLKKFNKIEDIDLVLSEQLAEKKAQENFAKLNINKSLFIIEYEDIAVDRKIGEGGSSSCVYKAKWKGKIVAFKCFKTSFLASDSESFEEFEKEVSILASVSHPNILEFYGATLKPPRVGFIMAFCVFGDLMRFLKKNKERSNKKFDVTEKHRIIIEIASAMDYLHSCKIVHRDLKCGNVLIDKNFESKLMDFGLSRAISKVDQTKTIRVGTSHYMAPEVTQGAENFNPYSSKSKQIPNFNIELRVAQNPDFRPDIKIEEFEDCIWVIGLMKQCWHHDPLVRPEFYAILNVLNEYAKFIDSNERQKNMRMIKERVGSQKFQKKTQDLISNIKKIQSLEEAMAEKDKKLDFYRQKIAFMKSTGNVVTPQRPSIKGRPSEKNIKEEKKNDLIGRKSEPASKKLGFSQPPRERAGSYGGKKIPVRRKGRAFSPSRRLPSPGRSPNESPTSPRGRPSRKLLVSPKGRVGRRAMSPPRRLNRNKSPPVSPNRRRPMSPSMLYRQVSPSKRNRPMSPSKCRPATTTGVRKSKLSIDNVPKKPVPKSPTRSRKSEL